MRDIEGFFTSSQENVTGKVFVQLLPYRFQIGGIESEHDLMSSKFGKYGEMNTGFYRSGCSWLQPHLWQPDQHFSPG